MLYSHVDFLVNHVNKALDFLFCLALLLEYFEKADELRFIHLATIVKIYLFEDLHHHFSFLWHSFETLINLTHLDRTTIVKVELLEEIFKRRGE